MHKPLFAFDFGAFPIYQALVLFAALVGYCRLNGELKKQAFSKYMRKRVLRSALIAAICGVICANVANWFVFPNGMDYSIYDRLTQGGFTFYFGMLAFFAVAALLLRLHKADVGQGIGMLVPAVLIAHFLGRLGCSLKGCCYGVELDMLGTTLLFPARELEALFLLVLFFALRKKDAKGRFSVYLFAYSLFRFGMEFLRGDNRGSLFGISALSPTQVVAIPVILVTAAVLFARPLLRLCNMESALDALGQKLRPKKQYIPRPADYAQPERKQHPLGKAVVAILVVIAIGLGCVLLNPFQWQWCDRLQLLLADTFGFLFAENSREETLGLLSGTTVLQIEEKVQVADEAAAQAFLQSRDNWSDAQFGKVVCVTLDTGNRLYVATQTVDGKPVLGSNRILVTDEAGYARYIAGDSAHLSFTDEPWTDDAGETRPLLQSFLDAGYEILEQESCWYNTGTGLLDAQHILLSEDIGVVVETKSQRVIRTTAPQLGQLSTLEAGSIRLALDYAAKRLEAGSDGESAQENTFFDIFGLVAHAQSFAAQAESVLKEMDEEAAATGEAVYSYLDGAGLQVEDCKKLLSSVGKIVTAVPGVNKSLMANVLICETEALETAAKASERQLQKLAGKLESALAAKDEKPLCIIAKTGKSTLHHAIDYGGDSDVFVIMTDGATKTQIDITATKPVKAEVYGEDGSAILSYYVEKTESIALSSADGTKFFLRVADAREGFRLVEENKYRIAVQSRPQADKIPAEIPLLISHLEQAYNQSNLSALLSVCTEDGKRPEVTDLILGAVASGLADSCASVMGNGELTDTAKTEIARYLCHDNGTDFLDALRGTTMKLSYIHHVNYGSGIALKLDAVISMEDVTVYDGYAFLQLIPNSQTQSPQRGEGTPLADVYNFLTSAMSYSIADTNTQELLAAFGDTPDSISVYDNIGSLYENLEKTTLAVGGVGVAQYQVNAAYFDKLLPQEQESAQKLILRYNLAWLKDARRTLNGQMQSEQLTVAVVRGGKILVDLKTGGPLAFVELLFQDNELVTGGISLYEYGTDLFGSLKDDVIDGIVDESLAPLESEVAAMQQGLDSLDAMIRDCEDRLDKLSD